MQPTQGADTLGQADKQAIFTWSVIESMLVRQLMDCEEFIAGDHTQLRERLHLDKQQLWARALGLFGHCLFLAIVDPAWKVEDETVYTE